MQRRARRSRRPQPRSRAQLQIERLEERLALSLSTVASFNGGAPYPGIGLVMDGNGNLYGTTTQVTPETSGTVFEIPKGSSTVKTLAYFDGSNGAYPNGGLVIDKAGNIYGTCQYEGGVGNVDLGTVFEVVKGSGKITVVADFTSNSGTGQPVGTPVMDSEGNLYGTALEGGASSPSSGSGAGSANGMAMGTGGGSPGNGAIYEVVKNSGKVKVLAAFDGADGSVPTGLAIDKNGNLFGTTSIGGAHNDGTVFELAKGSHTIKTLATFNGTNGMEPNQPIIDASGNLYSTTYFGGVNYHGGYSGYGTVFEVAQGSKQITTLARFHDTPGSNPEDSLAMDNYGNLFGTSADGGANSPVSGTGGDGMLFEVAKGSGTITDLAGFQGGNGSEPGGVAIVTGGDLYGTTDQGGANNGGTVFKFSPLAANAKTLIAAAGVAFSGTVATFTDAYPGGTVGDFAATINWGDGVTSAGTITTAGNAAGFVVTGSHVYAEAGTDKLVITITDTDGGKVTVDGAAKIAATASAQSVAAKDAFFARVGR